MEILQLSRLFLLPTSLPLLLMIFSMTTLLVVPDGVDSSPTSLSAERAEEDKMNTSTSTSTDDQEEEEEDPIEQNADLENAMEGDILLPPPASPLHDGPNGVMYAASTLPDAKWENGVVPYDFSEFPNPLAQEAVKVAISAIHATTCVKFRPKHPGDVYYVQFTADPVGCYSYVGVLRVHPDGSGRLPDGQVVNLGPQCWKTGIIQHELMHALGFYHEHSRYDRDDFVDIVWSHIRAKKASQFMKRDRDEVDHLGMDYDYRSIMHYRNTAFSKDGQKTIVTLDPKYANVIGQRKGFSMGDVNKIKVYYQCDKKPIVNANCDDRDPYNCPTWARNGGCQRRPGKMMYECRKTCGNCNDDFPCADTSDPYLKDNYCRSRYIGASGPTCDFSDFWGAMDCVKLEGKDLCDNKYTFIEAFEYCPKMCGRCK